MPHATYYLLINIIEFITYIFVMYDCATFYFAYKFLSKMKANVPKHKVRLKVRDRQ